MFSLLCLCGVLELDAKDALDGALAKYERRIAQYGEAGSVTLHPSRGDCGATPLRFGEGWSPHHVIFSCSRLFCRQYSACPR